MKWFLTFRKLKRASLLLILASAVAPFSAQAGKRAPSPKAPKASLIFVEKKMVREGFSKPFIRDVLASYEKKDFNTVVELNVLLYLRKSDYHGIQVTAEAQQDVKDFLENYKQALDKAESVSQVPRAVIASLMWIESRFGRNAGDFHVPSVYLHLIQAPRMSVQKFLLARTGKYADAEIPDETKKEVVARTHRKSAWAVTELRALEKVHKWKWKMDRGFRGSFSGAFGMPQFLPSSYVRWARSINHPAQPDLKKAEDAIMSVGHYLADHGWKTDQSATQLEALLKYNNSKDYANAILALAEKVTPRTAASQKSKGT